MTSVRLRLLVLALAPLTILLPLLLVFGMARWTADYDKVLIANVESDLRIAQQYLTRLMVGTGGDLTALARSAELEAIGRSDVPVRTAFFARKQRDLGLDFLYFLPAEDALEDAARWPVIVEGLNGRASSHIDIFGAQDLAVFPGRLDDRARIGLIETEAAVPTDRVVEDRGMVVHAASPARLGGRDGVLVGGILLNNNLEFIDRLNALVYLNAETGGERQGTATLFLDDVRISTNVRLFADVRALGTRVSAAVRGAVLGEGQTWLNRAFVVNDWYISGYLPIRDSFGERVGMLYVGFLEAPFATAKRDAVLWMVTAFALVLAVSVPVFLWMAKGIFAPLERMTRTMRRVGDGDLGARNDLPLVRDEIAQVASHMDNLLDQVQDRDARLRAHAEELNQRVEERTAELRDANAKLEETFRQLVMSEKLASIGEITAGVAHEINNPVAVIQGNMDVIRADLGERAAGITTEIDLIDAQIGRIQAIVGKLLQFASPGSHTGLPGLTDLGRTLTDCVVLVEHLLSNKAITLDLPPRDLALPPVRIDPGEMQQVIVNLMVNAIQAMGPEGTLSIALETRHRDGQPGVALCVVDTGPGLTQQQLSHVFDPFFTTKPAEGTGLGLSISQTLIQRAGGLISARNMAGGGAEFTVWMPQADAGAATRAAE